MRNSVSLLKLPKILVLRNFSAVLELLLKQTQSFIFKKKFYKILSNKILSKSYFRRFATIRWLRSARRDDEGLRTLSLLSIAYVFNSGFNLYCHDQLSMNRVIVRLGYVSCSVAISVLPLFSRRRFQESAFGWRRRRIQRRGSKFNL